MSTTLTSFLYRIQDDLSAVLVELLLIGLCINWLAGVLHGTRGTRPLRGVLIMLIVATVVVRVFGWDRLELLYHYIVLGLAFIGLVVFQPELRRAVIRVADTPFHRRRGPQSQLVAALVKSAGYLSRNKYGALIAIQRDVDLTGWAENGTMINAEVSANLLDTIFYPGSPLHDLGVIIRGTRVVAANCQFPSPESDEIDAALGSRHLAAVGMSYETDALVLVVSEETGVISLADNGKLTRYLTLDDLATELESRMRPSRGRDPGAARDAAKRSAFWQHARRVLMVIPLTFIIWYLADQATLVETNVDVELAIRHENSGFLVDILEPRTNIADRAEPRALVINPRFRGPRRAIDQLRADAGQGALKVTWVLPPAYARPSDYDVAPEQLPAILNGVPELAGRGLVVTQVNLKQTLEFSVDELETLTMPVAVTNEPVPVEVLRIDPPSVLVSVRQRDVAALPPEAQRTIRAPLGEERLRGLDPDQQRVFPRVALETQIGGARIVRVKPDHVAVTVRVALGRRETIRNVIVNLVAAPDVLEHYDVQKIDANEWRIDVTVTGKEETIRGLGPADITAFAIITSVQPSEDTLRLIDVILRAPEGATVVGSKAPTVRVNLVPRAGASP